MADIVWTTPAFLALEKLPEEIAFGIIRQTDYLRRFPQMGSTLLSRFKSLRRYRQLIYRRQFRIIYLYKEREDSVYIVSIQDCRRKLPTAQELKKAENLDDMSIDE